MGVFDGWFEFLEVLVKMPLGLIYSVVYGYRLNDGRMDGESISA